MWAALAMAAVVAVTPPAPVHHVEDHAVFLTDATHASVDATLAAYERETGHQVVVWIGRTLAGAPLDDWAARTFAAWKLGRVGHDDGLAIFIFADDRAVAIEVGYGLEERVPDAVASRLIREVMAPQLRAGVHDAAVVAGVDRVLATIEGHAWSASTASPTAEDPTPLEWTFYGVLGVIALLLAIKYPRAALWLFWSILQGVRSGSGRSHGGFSGGGGRSGGGGARGTWQRRR